MGAVFSWVKAIVQYGWVEWLVEFMSGEIHPTSVYCLLKFSVGDVVDAN